MNEAIHRRQPRTHIQIISAHANVTSLYVTKVWLAQASTHDDIYSYLPAPRSNSLYLLIQVVILLPDQQNLPCVSSPVSAVYMCLVTAWLLPAGFPS
jgi:hypothetical protein